MPGRRRNGVDSPPDRFGAADFWLLDRIDVPATVAGVDGRCIRLNPAAELVSGYTSADIRGRHIGEFVPPEAQEQIVAALAQVVERGEPADFETAFTDARGRRRRTRAQYLPLRDGAEIVGVLCLAFDVRLESLESFQPPPRLTRRQRQVLDLIAAGLTTPEIAEHLTLSTETVRNHLRGVYGLLHAHSRLEAVATAQRVGLLAPHALEADESPPAH